MEIPPRTSLQLALPLPKSPGMTIHVHLTFFKTSTMLFLTSVETEGSRTLTPMGSFVYAMPNAGQLSLM
jgi:Proteasome assembly chaperone 4